MEKCIENVKAKAAFIHALNNLVTGISLKLHHKIVNLFPLKSYFKIYCYYPTSVGAKSHCKEVEGLNTSRTGSTTKGTKDGPFSISEEQPRRNHQLMKISCQ